jgi:hypothetical protein
MKTKEKETLEAAFEIGYLWKSLDGTEPEGKGYYDSQETLNPLWSSFDSEEEAYKRLKEWYDSGSSGPYMLVKTFKAR